MIFVFGSNEAGRHGAGAARFALEHKGAIMGKGFGLAGQSFAIPTKDYQIETLPLSVIHTYIKVFKLTARERRDLTFQVTCIGCGLAGYDHQDIAPLFQDSSSNCQFDTLWRPWLGDGVTYWGTF